MDFRDYLTILRKSWLLVLLLLLTGTVSATAFSLIQTPIYQSSAKVFVSTQSTGSAVDLVQGNTFSVQRVKTYSDLALTPIVLDPVIVQLSLRESAAELAKSVTASSLLDTSMITIVASNPSPQLAADVANAAALSLKNVVQAIEIPAASDAASPVRLTIAQTAVPAAVPVAPNTLLNMGLGSLLGLLLGVGVALIREILDTRIKNEQDVRFVTSAPILGGIAFDDKAALRPLVVHVDPTSPRAESFRILRTNLQYLDIGRADRSFLVTSSIETEGKSTTTANLAIAMSDSGARVLLVDGDLRLSTVAQYMDIEGSVGLTDVLIGRVALVDAIQPWGRNQLFVLPAGHVPPNPSELLGSAAMHDLIANLNSQFDIVLFDAPPLLPVTDAAILAKSVGGVIIAVAVGRTHKGQLKSAITTLSNVGATVSGVVLTMVPPTKSGAYGYGYGYGHSYGRYGSDPTDERESRRSKRNRVSALSDAGDS
ncbi:MAG: polysaccharide biosynthesis tyrosine autokinase [Microbacteriaceae bacterium]|nr:polysaccharide biosynthesis tyrosine autokinase [Microbacteriaceae bacterium]